MSVGQLEEDATGLGDARLVPGERRSTLEARGKQRLSELKRRI
jgi:hypothetical protein